MTDVAGWPGHAVLQIPVPEMEDWIVDRTRFYDTAFLSDDPGFHHAHITVLAPITTWNLDAIADLAASSSPFDFELADIAVFPGGTIYLRADPVPQFKRLIHAAWRAHADVHPYGGDDPLPHLTLDRLSETVSVASTRKLITRPLPVHGRANSLELVWYRADECHLIERWMLGA